MVLILVSVIVIILALVVWIATHIFVTPNGHAIPVRRRGRHRRILIGGPYLLWPGESRGPAIDLGEHEARCTVFGVKIHAGFPVDVNLSYSRRVLPNDMPSEELYWTAEQRSSFEAEVLRDCLQTAVADTPLPFIPGHQDYSQLVAILSPFLGSPFDEVQRRFQSGAYARLAQHGIGLVTNSLEIGEVTLPTTFQNTERRLRSSHSDGAAVTEFVQGVYDAAPSLPPSSLVQLGRVAAAGTGWILDIFARGAFKPSAYAAITENIIFAEVEPVASCGGEDASIKPAGESGAAGAPGQSARNLPLAPEDMALLRQLPPL